MSTTLARSPFHVMTKPIGPIYASTFDKVATVIDTSTNRRAHSNTLPVSTALS